MIIWWLFKHYCRVFSHKWFVLVAAFKMFPISAPYWRLIKHDFSKLLYSEAVAYARHFYGKCNNTEEFSRAWLHHQNCNDHHWEYWISRSGHNDSAIGGPIDMPTDAIIEMVADWMGASRAYTGKWPTADNWKWFDTHWKNVSEHMSYHTRYTVEHILKIYIKGLKIEPCVYPCGNQEEALR